MMAEIITDACGCSVDWHKNHPLQSKTNYCPKHAAADELLKALGRCQRTIMVMNEIAPNYHLEGALKEAEAAIAQATKESEE